MPSFLLDPTEPQKPYLYLLERCSTLPQLKQIQASLTTSGLLNTHTFLNSKLIDTLVTKLPGSFHHALQLLSNSTLHACFTHNALMRALSVSSSPLNALQLFAKMLHPSSPNPDSSSFTFALKACARSHAYNASKAVHCLSITSGYERSRHVANTALHAYVSCGDLATARRLFDAIPSSIDAIKWNVMISGYVQNGLPVDALELFRRMWVAGVVPTNVTVVAALTGCARGMSVALGKQIHGFVSKMPMRVEREINVGTALLDMYAKCGCLDSAKQVFDSMEMKDTGAWNALMGGYVANGCFREALRSFDGLISSGLSPDEPTMVGALCACAHLGALDVGRGIHAYMEDRYHRIDAILGTSLVEMYSNCGCIEIARQVFDRMKGKDAMAWTSMIGALAAHGHAEDALRLFGSMRERGVRPDGVTLIGVLSACRHAGLVDKGLAYFRSMKREYGIVARVEHYGCMIDLYSRAGRLREALELIGSMEVDANPIIWRSFLSACRVNSDVEMAEIAVENLMRLRSGHDGDYVLLSNIYASSGRWEDARRARGWMKGGEIKKKPGVSLIEFPTGLEEGRCLL